MRSLVAVNSKWSKLYERVCVIFDTGVCDASPACIYVWGTHAVCVAGRHGCTTCAVRIWGCKLFCANLGMQSMFAKHIESQHAVEDVDFHGRPKVKMGCVIFDTGVCDASPTCIYVWGTHAFA